MLKIFGPKKDEVSEQFSMLCNKELCDLYRSPSVVRTLKSGILWWDACEALLEKSASCTKFWWENCRF